MDDETGRWRQANITFPDWGRAEQTAATHLTPALNTDDAAGLWWFIRKHPCWRIRYEPCPGHEALTGRRLDALAAAGHITGWTPDIYEPETHAFGCQDGMAVAHRLFHADSRHLLTHVARTAHTGQPRHRNELAILLCGALLRGAGLDWYEQGDVWARVADHRAPGPADDPPQAARSDAMEQSVRRFLTVDPAPLMADGEPLNHIADWSAAFTDAGARIAALATTGRLHRGLRAVLAHHVIFTWNRHGLPFTIQTVLAHTAKHTIFGPNPATHNARGEK